MRGVVFKSTGSWYEVKGDDGDFYNCRLRGKFKNDKLKLTNPIAVGDHVEFEIEEHEQSSIITTIHDRKNYIVRKSSRKKHHAHIIASNLDQAVLMVTLRLPRTSLGFIDRFLVSAESFRIPVVIIINKTDLHRTQDKKKANELKALYENIGCKVILTSFVEEVGLEEVGSALKDKVSLVAGHSGVGKSSLLNKINPELNLATGGLTKFTDKGSHTTTYAELFELSENTFIIDTPGIKEFGLEDLNQNEYSHYFPEMRAFLGQCKFNNCMHINEPDCAVLQAVENGSIATSRYSSYLSLLEDD